MKNLTSFWNLFKQMWSQKQRYIYLLFVINIFTVVFMTFFKIIMPDDYYAQAGLAKYWQNSYMWLTIYIDVAFCAVTCWQNEKVNMSQTWHLVAADERKWIRLLVIAILVVVAVYSGLIILSHLETLVDTQRMSPHANIIWQYDPLWLDTLTLFIVNLIFGFIDLWFIHSFVEPKIANY